MSACTRRTPTTPRPRAICRCPSNKLGDFFLRRGLEGDADRALKAYKDSLQTRQRLHQANPNDAQAARDLSVSFEQVSAISS